MPDNHVAKGFRAMRNNLSEKEVERQTEVTEKTIRNIENGRSSPKFDTLTKLLKFYKPSIDQVIELLELNDYMGTDAAYDASIDHQKMLERVSDTAFSCFFVSNDKPNNELDELQIEPLRYSKQGFSAAEAKVNEHNYDCKVICTKSRQYAVFSFASSDALYDRAIFMIPLRQNDMKLKAAVGIMVSLVEARDSSITPCFQKVCIVCSGYVEQIGLDNVKQVCKKQLELTFSHQPKYHMRMDDLSMKSRDFSDELKKCVEGKL